MSEATTPLPPPISGDAFTAYHESREAAIKRWVRREITLLGEGKGPEDREKENP